MTANPLWHLREWLTLEEAARSLSASLNLELGVADIFHLALDGHLKLSVYLPGNVALCFENGREHASRVKIDGVWDLPLTDVARAQVRHELHRELGLPFISMKGTRSAAVVRGRTRCVLVPDVSANGIDCRASSALPDDCMIVVQSLALERFLRRTRRTPLAQMLPTRIGRTGGRETPASNERELGTRERTTLLTLIAALAADAGIDVSKHSQAGDRIAALTQRLGAPVAGRTIENHLKQIPDALERRERSE